jgi:ribosome maturation factor RimP
VSSAIRKEKLIKLLEPSVQALGYELVELDAHVIGRGLLRVYIDHKEGITLSDCERVSRQLSAFLDVEDPLPGQYTLEVSSPGLDRRLRTLDHFQKFQNENVAIQLVRLRDGRRKLSGYLRGIKGETILIDIDGEILRLELADIESAQLIPAD